MKKLETALLSLLLFVPGSLRADAQSRGHMTGKLPDYRVADAAAPLVTDANVFANELFWPYQVELARAWKPPGRPQPLPRGELGILVRVTDSKQARIDFGRDGLYEVPIQVTDLVARSNGIRQGEVEKLAPNFLLAIGPRLLDSRSPGIRNFPFADAAVHRIFLCVFADPSRKEFGAIVSALAPLRARSGLLTVFFPQGRRPDSEVSGELRAMSWPVPYVYDHLSEAYTRTLLDEKTSLPAVLLQTSDGRVLFESRWGADAADRLSAALGSAGAASAAAEGARSTRR
jgi:hypothetical protein